MAARFVEGRGRCVCSVGGEEPQLEPLSAAGGSFTRYAHLRNHLVELLQREHLTLDDPKLPAEEASECPPAVRPVSSLQHRP